MSTPELVNIYGHESVEAIDALLGNAVTVKNLIQLIDNKYGTQLLSNKDLRLAIIRRLKPEEFSYVLSGDYDPGYKLSETDALSLLNMKWGRTQVLAQRLINVLGLDEHYLPPVKDLKPDHVNVEPSVYLYPHQLRLKNHFVREISGSTNKLLIHMPTGAGKTRTSIEGVIEVWKSFSDRSKSIIWIAHSEELCEQAFETFEKLWRVRGDTKIDIVRLWGSHALSDNAESTSGKIIVAGFQKLYSMITSEKNEVFKSISSLKQNSAIIVVDEAHKAIAPTYKACIEYLFDPDETKLIGLSATPGRAKDDIYDSINSETHQLASFFDNNKLGIVNSKGEEVADPISYLQEKEFLAKLVRKRVSTNIVLQLTDKELNFVSDFLELPDSVLKKLGENEERNALILSEVAALKMKNKQIILFAVSVKHARLLNELLNLKNIPSRCVDGQTSPYDREQAIADFKNGNVSVLVNYGVLTTGFDAPNTNAVVITRPTGSLVLYSQMIGRGIRGKKVGGNEECFLVDLEDNLMGFPSESLAFTHFNKVWK